MKNNIVRKFTETEVNMNSTILTRFSHAFSSFDVSELMDLLHENGHFFNGYNKGRAQGIFRKIFHGADGIQSRNCIQINRGISLSIFPGQEVLEIRCFNDSSTSFFETNPISSRKFGQAVDPTLEEVVFRFVFRFQDYKIIELKLATASIEHVEKLILKN